MVDVVARSPPPPPPNQTFMNGKTNQGKLCIILKGIYGRFRISLYNCEFTKFRDFAIDFASWPQKSRSGEIGQNFKVFLRIKYYEIRINQMINQQKLQKLIKVAFIFVNNVSVNSKPDHPPPPIFLMGEFPTPRAKRKFKTPTPRAYKNELKPYPGAFSSIIHYKNMKK